MRSSSSHYLGSITASARRIQESFLPPLTHLSVSVPPGGPGGSPSTLTLSISPHFHLSAASRAALIYCLDVAVTPEQHRDSTRKPHSPTPFFPQSSRHLSLNHDRAPRTRMHLTPCISLSFSPQLLAQDTQPGPSCPSGHNYQVP